MTISLTDVDEPPLAPAAPTVTATPIATDSLSVSWSAPSNTGRPAIDSYDLQYREVTTGTWTDGPQNVSGTSTTIAGLAADPAAYQVQVRATNDEGDGPWSPTGRIGGGGGGARNDPPLAVDDAAETVEGTAVFIDVLANDSDPNRDTLTVVEVSAPAHGTAVAAAGTVEYTPEPDFHGTDRFTYVVGDGSGLTARAAVEVTLFGVGKVRPAALMKTFGAELVGNQRTLPRTKLLQQLKKHRGRAAFRGEEERRARLVAELQQARLTGVRFKVPAATMSAKLANLPEGFPLLAAGLRCGSTGRRTSWSGSSRWRRRSGTITCGSTRSSSVAGSAGERLVTVTTEALTLSAAEPAIAPGRTYFDGSAIHYLTPSAPERNGPTSSLGLPLDSTGGAVVVPGSEHVFDGVEHAVLVAEHGDVAQQLDELRCPLGSQRVRSGAVETARREGRAFPRAGRELQRGVS